jgi:hypothetical protein
MDKIDYDYLSDKEIDCIMREEDKYRIAHGNTCAPDENLCKYCRNIDKQNHFCWDCDSGSMYLPITRPLYNLCLMFLSLNSELENAENDPDADRVKISKQKGVIESLRFVMQPFGIKEALYRFQDEIINGKDYYTLKEIENAEMKYTFKQKKETEEEKKYREKVGTIRCYKDACTHCKYNYRFDKKFCWDCDRGTNFRNGIRSIQTIEKMLMFINTESGEALMNQVRNEEMTIIRISLAEGLKWIIEPYTTEEELIEKNGFEYVSNEDINLIIQQENEEYEFLDTIENDSEMQKTEFEKNPCEDEDPMETIKNNIPKYIKELIIAGDRDSIIKSKVIAQLAILGLSLSDSNVLNEEISSIRRNLKIGKS